MFTSTTYPSLMDACASPAIHNPEFRWTAWESETYVKGVGIYGAGGRRMPSTSSQFPLHLRGQAAQAAAAAALAAEIAALEAAAVASYDEDTTSLCSESTCVASYGSYEGEPISLTSSLTTTTSNTTTAIGTPTSSPTTTYPSKVVNVFARADQWVARKAAGGASASVDFEVAHGGDDEGRELELERAVGKGLVRAMREAVEEYPVKGMESAGLMEDHLLGNILEDINDLLLSSPSLPTPSFPTPAYSPECFPLRPLRPYRPTLRLKHIILEPVHPEIGERSVMINGHGEVLAFFSGDYFCQLPNWDANDEVVAGGVVGRE